MFRMQGTTGTTSGNVAWGLLSSDIIEGVYMYRLTTRASSNVTGASSAIIPVQNREIIVLYNSSNSGNFNLYAVGYKRKGII